MKKLQKIIFVTFLMGSMLMSALFTQSQGLSMNSNSTISNDILPYVYAGPDMAICNGSKFKTQGEAPLEGTTFWVTNGDGTFDNPYNPKTFYTPGQLDIANGQVTLTFHLIPLAMTVNPMQDDVTVYLNICVNPKKDEQ